jgi:hypothetical protein
MIATLTTLMENRKSLCRDWAPILLPRLVHFSTILKLLEGSFLGPSLSCSVSLHRSSRLSSLPLLELLCHSSVSMDLLPNKKGVTLLLSLRAGGVGLNLTMAKRVYMMDPWWSFAVEAQAIDRVHRMGQVDEVKVYRFIVKESVEQRMLKIQDRKKFM